MHELYGELSREGVAVGGEVEEGLEAEEAGRDGAIEVIVANVEEAELGEVREGDGELPAEVVVGNVEAREVREVLDGAGDGARQV